ncbi:hypothetical protein G6F31_018198 [Rhizopus arrhizus]|nr:hypothetical protein G6F31_018198 [Rhizopus arrhizus]
MLYPTTTSAAHPDISGWSPDRIARVGVAIVPEGRQCFPNLTVREHLTAFVAARNPDIGEPWTPERVFELFPRLAARARNRGHQLAGGEQQMLAIARILRTGAQLILLDEPTEGLAPVIVQQIGQAIRTLKERGFTIVLVEQNFRFATKVADRHYVMEHGCVVDRLSADEARRDPARIARRLGV